MILVPKGTWFARKKERKRERKKERKILIISPFSCSLMERRIG